MNESFFSTTGRLRRRTYFLRAFPICLLISLLDQSRNEGAVMFFMVIGIPIIIIQAIKRLHDIDQSGWLMLLTLVPLVNVILGIYVLVAPGTPGSNRFGENPRKQNVTDQLN